MVDKQHVKKSFSKAALSYDINALFQKEIADVFLAHLPHMEKRMPTPKTVVDIGAGTGSVSIEISKRYPGAAVLSIDLAFGMSLMTLVKSKDIPNIKAVTADVESLPITDSSIDFIVSNLTIQWAADQRRAFKEIFRSLKPDGAYFLNIIGIGSLPELRESYQAGFKENEDGIMLNHYPSFDEIKSIIEWIMPCEVTLWKNSYTKYYNDSIHFLKTLKSIGATNPYPATQHAKEIGMMNKMLEYYDTNFMTSRGIPATYEVIFVKGKK